MTTIIYKDGSVYADTQITTIAIQTKTIMEICEQDKISIHDDCVMAATGYCAVSDIFQKKFFRKLLNFRFFPIFGADVLKEEYATLLISENENVKILHVDVIWKLFKLAILKVKIYSQHSVHQEYTMMMGSRVDTEIFRKVENGDIDPERAIVLTSELDKYTNNKVTKVNLREFFQRSK